MTNRSRHSRAYQGTADRRTFPRWAHYAFGIALALLTVATCYIAAAIYRGMP